MDLRKTLTRGDHLVWLTGSALGISLLMIIGLLVVILTNGLGIFWPSKVVQLTLKDGSLVAGEPTQRQAIPNPGHADHNQNHRLQLKVGNRDLYGFDFKWIDEVEIQKRDEPRRDLRRGAQRVRPSDRHAGRSCSRATSSWRAATAWLPRCQRSSRRPRATARP